MAQDKELIATFKWSKDKDDLILAEIKMDGWTDKDLRVFFTSMMGRIVRAPSGIPFIFSALESALKGQSFNGAEIEKLVDGFKKENPNQ